MLVPTAAFDCLLISVQLSRVLGTVGRGEIHLFSYLGCLMSLYDRQPVSDWGYIFAGTKEGSPFAPDMEDALEFFVSQAFLLPDEMGTLFSVEEAGRAEFEALRTLDSLRARERYLEAACASVLTLPVGRIRSALAREPSLAGMAHRAGTHLLLEGQPYEELYGQLGKLSELIGVNMRDLLVPAVIWLNYLYSLKTEDVVGDQQVVE